MIRHGERESEREKYDRRKFREVLIESAEGRYVLTALLQDLGYWEPSQDDRGRVLRNFAQRILDHLGITHEASILDYVDALSKIPVYQGTQETE